MMKPIPLRPGKRPAEDGYMLVAVIFMLALLVISLSIALPKVRKSIQRDQELETMNRGKQYMRAVQLYYRKFGSYPPNVDALVKTNNARFLRKKYIDPVTGKDDWKPVLFGQNKAPTAMGFFGQPLGGSTMAGIGPSGGNGLAGSSTTGGLGSSTDSSAAAASSSASTAAATTPAAGTTSAAGTTGTADSSSASAFGSTTSPTGATFGGGGIIGFSPGSPKQSILVYKKKNHYNEWEFTYDPLADQMTAPGNPASQSSTQTGALGAPAQTTTTTAAPASTTTPATQQ
jgi:type II secretory pathway pseudopilin PulG